MATQVATQAIKLPAPIHRGTLSIEEVLTARRSVREYTNQQLDLGMIGQLLWAAQGITDRDGLRTAPSAGALYSLEVRVVTHDGLFHYVPQSHELQQLATTDLRPALARAAHNQDAVRTAPLVIVFTAVYERTAVKYGDRAERYVHMEAGHAAQNVLLQATALGLGAVPMGAFNDADVARVLSLPRSERALYLVPVGHPRG